MSKKVVLEEDQYVEALERIIERDFFPDLPALRKHSARLQSDGGNTGLVRSADADSVVSTVPRGAQLRSQVPASVARSESSAWDQPTPSRLPFGDDDGNAERNNTNDVSGRGPRDEQHTEDMTLNRFVATHTSEDNAAFTELQEKAIEDHKRRYHWAYDSDGSRGDAKLHLLTNGQWISKEQRQIVDKVLAPDGPTDHRPSAPDTWPFRARNALLFMPDLEASMQICKVGSSRNVPLLENKDHDERGHLRELVKLGDTDKRVLSRSKGETVYANSRFKADDAEPADSKIGGVQTYKNESALVQMTPQIAPGIDASPLMTWGDIEGTPMILDARATPEQVLSGPRFVVKESSTREKIASRLESQTRLRKSQSRQQTPTPLVAGSKRRGQLATPSRGESIRSRLSSVRSVQRTPLFGSNSELRASYATPLLPPRHFKSRPPKK